MDRINRLRENLATVRQICRDAAQTAGRAADSVRVVGVTKYVDRATTELLAKAGCLELGENRPQVLWDKAEAWEGPQVTWHMIGHLQRNKVARTLRHAELIHSGDSLRLLQELDKIATAQKPVRVLLEVNISGDSEKGGFPPTDLAAALTAVANLKNIQVQGLMAMASADRRGEEARVDFAALRELRDSCLMHCPESVSLSELSMGMSGDYVWAIQEGATIVRVGSALLEGVV
jgi:pyridoxal phosphate enzyme (YggS family)